MLSSTWKESRSASCIRVCASRKATPSTVPLALHQQSMGKALFAFDFAIEWVDIASHTMHVPEVAIVHEDALRPARNSTLSNVGEQANVCQAESPLDVFFFLHWNRFRFRLTYEGLRFIESHGIPTLPTTLTLNEPITSMQMPDLASKLTNPEVCTKFDQSNEMKSNVRRAYAYARRESRSRKKNAANRLA